MDDVLRVRLGDGLDGLQQIIHRGPRIRAPCCDRSLPSRSSMII